MYQNNLGDCTFCTISKTARQSVAWTSKRLMVFSDHRPIRPGHVQIIPRAHFEVFDDLPAALASEIIHLGQRIAKAQKRLYGVSRVGFVFTGNEVAHVHAHVIPLHAADVVTSARYRDPGVPVMPWADQVETAAILRASLSEV